MYPASHGRRGFVFNIVGHVVRIADSVEGTVGDTTGRHGGWEVVTVADARVTISRCG